MFQKRCNLSDTLPVNLWHLTLAVRFTQNKQENAWVSHGQILLAFVLVGVFHLFGFGLFWEEGGVLVYLLALGFWFFICKFVFFKELICQCINFISTTFIAPLAQGIFSVRQPLWTQKEIIQKKSKIRLCIFVLLLYWFRGLRSASKFTSTSLAMTANLEGYC